jgi:hypothetical protein
LNLEPTLRNAHPGESLGRAIPGLSAVLPGLLAGCGQAGFRAVDTL